MDANVYRLKPAAVFRRLLRPDYRRFLSIFKKEPVLYDKMVLVEIWLFFTKDQKTEELHLEETTIVRFQRTVS